MKYALDIDFKNTSVKVSLILANAVSTQKFRRTIVFSLCHCEGVFPLICPASIIDDNVQRTKFADCLINKRFPGRCIRNVRLNEKTFGTCCAQRLC